LPAAQSLLSSLLAESPVNHVPSSGDCQVIVDALIAESVEDHRTLWIGMPEPAAQAALNAEKPSSVMSDVGAGGVPTVLKVEGDRVSPTRRGSGLVRQPNALSKLSAVHAQHSTGCRPRYVRDWPQGIPVDEQNSVGTVLVTSANKDLVPVGFQKVRLDAEVFGLRGRDRLDRASVNLMVERQTFDTLRDRSQNNEGVLSDSNLAKNLMFPFRFWVGVPGQSAWQPLVVIISSQVTICA
jgi:hypothetical protein